MLWIKLFILFYNFLREYFLITKRLENTTYKIVVLANILVLKFNIFTSSWIPVVIQI